MFYRTQLEFQIFRQLQLQRQHQTQCPTSHTQQSGSSSEHGYLKHNQMPGYYGRTGHQNSGGTSSQGSGLQPGTSTSTSLNQSSSEESPTQIPRITRDHEGTQRGRGGRRIDDKLYVKLTNFRIPLPHNKMFVSESLESPYPMNHRRSLMTRKNVRQLERSTIIGGSGNCRTKGFINKGYASRSRLLHHTESLRKQELSGCSSDSPDEFESRIRSVPNLSGIEDRTSSGSTSSGPVELQALITKAVLANLKFGKPTLYRPPNAGCKSNNMKTDYISENMGVWRTHDNNLDQSNKSRRASCPLETRRRIPDQSVKNMTPVSQSLRQRRMSDQSMEGNMISDQLLRSRRSTSIQSLGCEMSSNQSLSTRRLSTRSLDEYHIVDIMGELDYKPQIIIPTGVPKLRKTTSLGKGKGFVDNIQIDDIEASESESCNSETCSSDPRQDNTGF